MMSDMTASIGAEAMKALERSRCCMFHIFVGQRGRGLTGGIQCGCQILRCRGKDADR